MYRTIYYARARRREPRNAKDSIYAHCNRFTIYFALRTAGAGAVRECRPTYMTKPPTAHAVRIAMRIRAKNYSLTAPAVSPLTIYLTRKKYRTTIGTATNTEPAAKRANSVSPRLISPTATV